MLVLGFLGIPFCVLTFEIVGHTCLNAEVFLFCFFMLVSEMGCLRKFRTHVDLIARRDLQDFPCGNVELPFYL